MPDPIPVLYPEAAAGGFSRADGTVAFYIRVNALLEPSMTVLDYGAGRGVFADEPDGYRRRLQMLRGKVARVIGADVDPAVLGNPALDEAHVLDESMRLPLEDASVDLIVSDHTFEHLDDPGTVVPELDRVLRPGGWICARTPNRHGYIALGARLVPNAFHRRALHRLQARRLDEDVFPTRYHLNTRAQLEEHFPASRFELYAYTHNAEPAYFGGARPLWRVVQGVHRVLPPALGVTWMVFVRKSPVS